MAVEGGGGTQLIAVNEPCRRVLMSFCSLFMYAGGRLFRLLFPKHTDSACTAISSSLVNITALYVDEI